MMQVCSSVAAQIIDGNALSVNTSTDVARRTALELELELTRFHGHI